MPKKRAVKKNVCRKRISDKKPLVNYKSPRGEKKAFQEMVKRDYPAIKGGLSKKLAKCFYTNWCVNEGEQLFTILNIFKEAAGKRGAQNDEIDKYIERTQTRFNTWMKTHSNQPMRRKIV